MIKPKPTIRPSAKSAQRKGKTKSHKKGLTLLSSFKRNMPLFIMESLGVIISASLATMIALGFAANSFTGTEFFANILPFTLGVVCWIGLAALALISWIKLRSWLVKRAVFLPACLAVILSGGVIWYVAHAGYTSVFTHFRGLVGGKQQAARTTLAHQVYAAYRRYDQTDLQKMMERSETFKADVTDAAAHFDLDLDILLGVAATESSFLPRDSHDGGHGLFQITAVPKFLLEQAKQQLKIDKLSLLDQRHNAFVAAATLKYYLAEMNNDLFLGLLAYNIGPKNGGLKFIMDQYGANDFISMQPYLQQLPRDYPIRVLSYSLAFRLWHQEGKLLAYQDGDNAVHIQRMGIPGLVTVF
ncbi:transglycosylase SLT domain-containing protein [Methylomonas sp. AM2-LC]|uniref:transglycosylase SLT domain-containing protein n=1 Tax=Methylomonas sp. AM2-LC TaxID=3153301 RepID=UPI0032646917